MIVTAANALAMRHGITTQMVLADARAIMPDLQVQEDQPALAPKLLKRLAIWCIRFTPIASVDLPDGIIFDATGCTHLWGGEQPYLQAIIERLSNRGYDVRAALADTPGVAWAVARYGIEDQNIKSMPIPAGKHLEALLHLPSEALRLESEAVERLHKLGLHRIKQFISMPRASLRRRFGVQFLNRLDLVTGRVEDVITPVMSPDPYRECLPCLDPIVTTVGIEIALHQLMETLCQRLRDEQKGMRYAIFKGHRVDGKIEQIEIGTSRPSHHVEHLFKLFELKISSIEPALGIEVFVLEASKVEDHFSTQESLWETSGCLDDHRVSELIDRVSMKCGVQPIRYIPAEHYWPERSIKVASSLQEKTTTAWRKDRLRPLLLLAHPEKIEVTAPIPDYPPMLFQYKGKLHRIVSADGPERIEQEWWLQQGQHRDYYRVEDQEGKRYWLFRLGHYHDKTFQWFIHGYFA
jgi:protein ImuB